MYQTKQTKQAKQIKQIKQTSIDKLPNDMKKKEDYLECNCLMCKFIDHTTIL